MIKNVIISIFKTLRDEIIKKFESYEAASLFKEKRGIIMQEAAAVKSV